MENLEPSIFFSYLLFIGRVAASGAAKLLLRRAAGNETRLSHFPVHSNLWRCNSLAYKTGLPEQATGLSNKSAALVSRGLFRNRSF
jgi:hypothetical protein